MACRTSLQFESLQKTVLMSTVISRLSDEQMILKHELVIEE